MAQNHHFSSGSDNAQKPHTSVKLRKYKYCDFCRGDENNPNVVAVVDGSTTLGFWANMCDRHFALYGLGLGLGVGQRLIYV